MKVKNNPLVRFDPHGGLPLRSGALKGTLPIKKQILGANIKKSILLLFIFYNLKNKK
jgi:hypothetical protein